MLGWCCGWSKAAAKGSSIAAGTWAQRPCLWCWCTSIIEKGRRKDGKKEEKRRREEKKEKAGFQKIAHLNFIWFPSHPLWMNTIIFTSRILRLFWVWFSTSFFWKFDFFFNLFFFSFVFFFFFLPLIRATISPLKQRPPNQVYRAHRGWDRVRQENGDFILQGPRSDVGMKEEVEEKIHKLATWKPRPRGGKREKKKPTWVEIKRPRGEGKGKCPRGGRKKKKKKEQRDKRDFVHQTALRVKDWGWCDQISWRPSCSGGSI